MSSLCVNGNMCLGLPHPEFQLSEKKKEKKIKHKPYCDICRCNGNVFIGVPYPECQLDSNQTAAGESICGHHPKPKRPCCEKPAECCPQAASYSSPDCCHGAIDGCQGEIMLPHTSVSPVVNNCHGDTTGCNTWQDGAGELGTHYTCDCNGGCVNGHTIELPCSATIHQVGCGTGCPLHQAQVPMSTQGHYTMDSVTPLH